jgi:hypothetical protein
VSLETGPQNLVSRYYRCERLSQAIHVKQTFDGDNRRSAERLRVLLLQDPQVPLLR